jgi:hypothetical protein
MLRDAPDHVWCLEHYCHASMVMRHRSLVPVSLLTQAMIYAQRCSRWCMMLRALLPRLYGDETQEFSSCEVLTQAMIYAQRCSRCLEHYCHASTVLRHRSLVPLSLLTQAMMYAQRCSRCLEHYCHTPTVHRRKGHQSLRYLRKNGQPVSAAGADCRTIYGAQPNRISHSPQK